MNNFEVNVCSENEIEQLKFTELKILDVYDAFCKEHNLKYSLAFGTLLGAVRHKGFIPWDDDVDVMMPRQDYERFRNAWESNPKDGFIIQDYKTVDDTCNNFIQLKKDHTTLINYECEKSAKKHKGIKLDIFPVDRVAPNYILRKYQYTAAVLNLLFSRGYINETSSKISKTVQNILLIGNEKSYVKRVSATEHVMKRWAERGDLCYVCFDVIADCKKIFPSDIFDETIDTAFEDRTFKISSKYESILNVLYGDYRKLPPTEEQVNKHHPLIIDVNKNYEERNHDE